MLPGSSRPLSTPLPVADTDQAQGEQGQRCRHRDLPVGLRVRLDTKIAHVRAGQSGITEEAGELGGYEEIARDRKAGGCRIEQSGRDVEQDCRHTDRALDEESAVGWSPTGIETDGEIADLDRVRVEKHRAEVLDGP